MLQFPWQLLQALPAIAFSNCVSVCVSGCVTLVAGVRGRVEGSGVSSFEGFFWPGFFFFLFVCLGDPLDLSSGIVL